MNVPVSSSKKGDEFEKRVFEMIQFMLTNDELPINCRHSKVYRQKAYYSSQRKSNIKVDVSVECVLPGETQPSAYIMVECKDYSHAVPVDDVEEFSAKMRQITGFNVKALLVTTNVLQESALTFAQANNIRVMRIRPGGQREVLSFRKEKSSLSEGGRDFANAILALTSPAKSMISPVFIGVGDVKVYYTFSAILIDTINS